jgi:D-alanyl-lipoteichoic acid acyltransferase DltB (MBOAT superfamily)
VVFNSFEYVGFLAATVAAFWLCPWAYRRHLLLGASIVFYGLWDWRLLGLLALTTLSTFFLGALIHRLPDGAARRLALGYALVLSLGVLVAFKFYAFFLLEGAGEGSLSASVASPALELAVPVGLSYYTFMAASYVIDISRREQEPATSLLDYALFVTFFPHLLAGPILRAKRLIPNIQHLPARPDPTATLEGLELLLTGFFKKIVLGDPLVASALNLIAGGADGSVGENGSLMSLLGLVSFTLGAFFDVSGYIDIARGSARLLGVEMQPNFAQPLTRSKNFTDFWRRWQITVMAWFRDYVFRPLRGGARRPSEGREVFALFATFLVVGAWHGVGPTWIIWGALTGTILTAERILRTRNARRRRALAATGRGSGGRGPGTPAAGDTTRARRDPVRHGPTPWGLAYTLVAFLFVMVWVIAPDVPAAFDLYRSIFGFEGGPTDWDGLVLAAGGVLALVLTDRRELVRDGRVGTWDPPTTVRLLGFGVMLVLIVVFSGAVTRPFFYLRF